jgi:pimeloyl-ACP methyl ester carboxylesterase
MKPSVEALARDWRVIGCSLPGEPGSGADLNGDFESFIRHVDNVLDTAQVERPVLCGVSFGGLIALRYAARRPDRVRALILVSTPGPRWKLKPHLARYARWPTLSSPLFVIGAARRFRRELRAIYPGRLGRVNACMQTIWRVATAPAVPRRMSRRARLAERENFEGDCAVVTVPTLVVTGEPDLDQVVPCDETMRYVELIPGASFRLFEHTGHLGTVLAPERFATIVSRFANNG